MPGEKRHAAALLGEQEALGANWKSAQCVTSLYDSYIQLQRENEALKDEARRLQQENGALLAAQSKQDLLRDPQETRVEELQQEVKLLRSEKRRMEDAHRLEARKLEARVASSETQHQQLVTKYRERFEFDPLEAKRAAMAVKTMQNTLQNAVLEKEELGIRYGELKEQYRKFHAEQSEIVETLRKQVRAFEQQRVRVGQQRVVNALAVWSTNKVQNAWNKWIALAKEMRQQEENRKIMASFECKVDERVAKIKGNQAAVLAMKLLQQSARRTFLRWKDLAWKNMERRRKGDRLAKELCRKSVKRALDCWRVECQKVRTVRNGAAKIERLVACHSRNSSLRKWSVQTFRLALAEKDQKLEALSSTVEFQANTIIELEHELDGARSTNRAMISRHEEEKAAFVANVEAHRAVELAIRQKLGRFFTKLSDRQLLKDVLQGWRLRSKYLKFLNQRLALARTQLRNLKLRRSVCDWYGIASQNQKRRSRRQQILGRMRQLCVLKCFNSWKEHTLVEKTRKTALLHSVNRLQNRGVARSFTQWAAFRSHRLSLRLGIDALEKYALKQQVFFAYSLWKERVTELKIQLQVRQEALIKQAWEDRIAQTKKDLNFQRECFTRWREAVLYRQRSKALVKKCLSRLRNGSMARVLGSWCGFVVGRKAQRDLVRRWLERCRTGELRKAWTRWQRQIALKERQILIARLEVERGAELKKLRDEFDTYRTAQLAMLERAEQLQTQQSCKLQDVAQRLREETKRVQRFKGAVKLLCSNRERESAQLKYFKAWQKVVRRLIRNNRTIQTFQSILDTRKSRMVLEGLKRFAFQQKQLRNVFQTLCSCYARWLEAQCFQAWNEARRRSRAVQVFSALFARNSEVFICHEVFAEWKKLARKNQLLRRTLEQIWLGSVHAQMRNQFNHWVEFTKAEAAKEQLTHRNVALTAIRAKVWWKRSISCKRLCFTEWKCSIKAMKQQRQGERKMILFQQMRLMSLCFTAWTAFVAAQANECERNLSFERSLRKIVRRKQQNVISLWKSLVILNQLQDIQQLKEVQNSQQEELHLQREEITMLMQSTAETKSLLTQVSQVHSVSTTKVQHLTERGLVTKYFNALKLNIAMKKYQRQATQLSQKNAKRRHLAELFCAWYSFSQNSRVAKLAAAQKAKRCEELLTRTALREWRTFAIRLRVLKRKQYKLQLRVRSRIIKTNFAEWHQLIHRERNISVAMETLEVITHRIMLKSTLNLWHQIFLQERHQAHQEREKQRRIIQFLMGRQEAVLVRTFYSWKEHHRSKQVLRLQAYKRYTKRCLSTLANSLQCWRSMVNILKVKRSSVQCIQAVATRYYYRVAISRWRRLRFVSQIALLESSNTALSLQVAESNNRLATATMSIDKLSTELMELHDKLHEAESKASTVHLEATSVEARQARKLHCLNALSKIMMKRMVSREVSEAFAIWKARVVNFGRKQLALTNVTHIRKRRARWYAFWLWKVKALRLRQLDAFKRLWGRHDLLTILRRWKKYSTSQAKLRYFLTKRCLLSSSSHGLSISIAFRLWKSKSQQLSAFQQVVELHTKLRGEQESSSTHLRRLALGKWCWIAYTHRLQQMRKFFSRCYTNSINSCTIKHRRAIEEVKQSSDDAIAKFKELTKVQAQEDLAALSDAEEQLTTGSSFQALQTLIRRLFQSTTVKDLFVSVGSTFAQIVHGSAAVLFLFDPSSNELWTQREENQLIQVPASLGIAGSTLSSGSTLIITDVASDTRFHPMVDQFVLSSLRQDDATAALMMATSRARANTAKPIVGMVSSALVSPDG
ncbi:unnamed protein product [Phytophthora fragariaefolia]|uniref:Unnamed protein product n=1 Tax=Phytophthora fragariaefolia TaxID=1490495 RepID=A0A9W6WY37_9STRA|nr:unnamed protein product [Phytophthora fragariaefolia]